MKAEEFFDKIYTIHINDFIRMPKKELYELMEAYAKQEREEMKFCPHCGKRKRMKGDGTIEQLCTC